MCCRNPCPRGEKDVLTIVQMTVYVWERRRTDLARPALFHLESMTVTGFDPSLRWKWRWRWRWGCSALLSTSLLVSLPRPDRRGFFLGRVCQSTCGDWGRTSNFRTTTEYGVRSYGILAPTKSDRSRRELESSEISVQFDQRSIMILIIELGGHLY